MAISCSGHARGAPGQRVGREPSRLGAGGALERRSGLHRFREFRSSSPSTIAMGRPRSRRGATSIRSLTWRRPTDTRLTVIQLHAEVDEPSGERIQRRWTSRSASKRSDTIADRAFLAAKLAGAGCDQRIFTPRAITRLHALSRGCSAQHRKCGDLLSGSLVPCKARIVPPELVETVARDARPTRSDAGG